MTTQRSKTSCSCRSSKDVDILKNLKKLAGKHTALKKHQEYDKQTHNISFKNVFSTSTYLKQELGTAYLSYHHQNDQDFSDYEPPKTPLKLAERKNYKENFSEKVYSEKKPDEEDLISLITQQMLLAERELQITRRHLIETNNKLNEKDAEILRLNEKIKSLQSESKEKRQNSDATVREGSKDRQSLTGALKKLKKQVKDMEEFLDDYGLVWIGDETDTQPDFDKIVQNFERLNSVACQPKITHTPSGAKFELPREIPLELYSNGFLLRGTDFREYNRTSAKLFLLDVEDGYFPSELQGEYPEGVPFQVTDKRSEIYKPEKSFQNQGNRLGSVVEKFNNTEKPYCTPADSNNTLKLKVKLEDTKEEFLVELSRTQKMQTFQKILSQKLCDTAIANSTVSYTIVDGSIDFKVHIYGRKSFRLSECLNLYPEDCGIVRNCVVNVTALTS